MKNKKTSTTHEVLSQTIEDIKLRNYAEIPPDNIPKLIERVKTLESLSQNRKSIIILVSIKKVKVLYVSANIKEKLGYEQKELLVDNEQGFFKLYPKSSMQIPAAHLRWGKTVRAELSVHTNPNEQEAIIYHGGMKLQHKNGKTSLFFIRIITLNHVNNNLSSVLYFAEEINHLMKDDTYWSYFIVGKDQAYKRFFSNNTRDKGLAIIFTKREEEILVQINSGKSSKDISTLLDISINTVERHRKNMIAKLGAKDSTALLHLCKMCSLI